MASSHTSKKSKAASKRKVGESSQAAPISHLHTWFQDEKYKSDYVGLFGGSTMKVSHFS